MFWAGDEVARAGGPIRSDGSYYLPFVASGSSWIEVSPDAPGPEIGYCTGAQLNIPIDAIEWNFDLRLGRSSSIAGRLLEADGRPVRNGVIRLDGVDANSTRTLHSGADGGFAFDGVLPGEYELAGARDSRWLDSGSARAHAGESNIELRLPARGDVRGRVVDAHGRVVSNAYVTFAAEGTLWSYGYTGTDGTFSTSFAGSVISIAASTRTSVTPTSRVKIEPGQETVVPDLVLEPLASLWLVAGRAATDARYELWRGEVLCATGSIHRNTEQSVITPSGQLRLVVTATGSRSEEHTFEIAAGTTTMVPILFVH